MPAPPNITRFLESSRNKLPLTANSYQLTTNSQQTNKQFPLRRDANRKKQNNPTHKNLTINSRKGRKAERAEEIAERRSVVQVTAHRKKKSTTKHLPVQSSQQRAPISRQLSPSLPPSLPPHPLSISHSAPLRPRSGRGRDPSPSPRSAAAVAWTPRRSCGPMPAVWVMRTGPETRARARTHAGRGAEGGGSPGQLSGGQRSDVRESGALLHAEELFSGCGRLRWYK